MNENPTAAILSYEHDANESYSDNNVLAVFENLRNIGVSVFKIDSVLANNLLVNIETSLKLFDYVCLIINSGGCNALNSVNHSLSKLFNQSIIQKSNLIANSTAATILEHFKILSYKDSTEKGFVLYMQGLFILCPSKNSEPLVADIIVPFLKGKFNTSYLKRILYLKKEVDVEDILQVVDNDIKVDLMEENVFLKLTISALNLKPLISFENSLRNCYGSAIVKAEEGSDIDEVVYQYNYDYVKHAIKTIEECFERYGPNNVLLGFNGGKDCTVLLHLALGVLRRRYSDRRMQLSCLYIQSSDPFEELEEFVSHCAQYYDLNVIVLNKSIKESLDYVLKMKPNVQACLMGTRRNDPFAREMQTFQMTDKDWPQVMRVSPLLDWHYSHVWDYLLDLHVPYCSLYDKGYTSIGNRSNSKPNPSLYFYDSLKGEYVYLPAYKLLDSSQERTGRSVRP